MPPKAKFSKEEITFAAFSILREEGMQALTARALGARLGSSARPIFTVFQNMEEVQQAAVAAAHAEYSSYVARGLAQTPAFKGVGTEYIRFARQEPRLFQLLFMKEPSGSLCARNVLPAIDENYAAILASITGEYGLGHAAAQALYLHLWVYTHGIATLLATKVCDFNDEEISHMLTDVFISLLQKSKGEKTQ